MNDNVPRELRPKPPSLPATPEAWAASRKVKGGLTLNDHVEAIHKKLAGSVKAYDLLLDPVYDEDASEGSLSYDNFKAAEVIRNYALETNDEGVMNDRYVAHVGEGERLRPLASLVKALNVVLRRYDQDRKSRAERIGGISDSDA